MSGGQIFWNLSGFALAGAVAIGAQTAVANDNPSSSMTAGLIMDKMETTERFHYVTGIIEGLAYARLVKDTKSAGKQESKGMNCIYGWFYADPVQQMIQVEGVFKKYPDHFPAVLLTALIRRKCGE